MLTLPKYWGNNKMSIKFAEVTRLIIGEYSTPHDYPAIDIIDSQNARAMSLYDAPMSIALLLFIITSMGSTF